MSLKDLIQNKLSDEDKTKIDQLLTELETVLKDKLVGLSPEDRQKYGTVNEQNKLFINKIQDFVEGQPTHNPSEINWEEFQQDFIARKFLETRANRLNALVYQMNSTKMLHDYDNYQDSLAYYNYINYRKDMNVPGASEIYTELKQFFPRTSKPSNVDNESDTSEE